MRYLPIVGGLGALVLAANTLAYEPNSLQVQQPQAEVSQATAFEKFIHRTYQKNQELIRRNNQYIADNAGLREDIQSIVSDSEKAKQDLVARLGSFEHSYRYDNESPKNVLKLSPRQLVRVYLIMEALKTEKFRTQIGEIIEEDLKDADSEHGGLGLFDEDKNLELHDIPSASKGDNGRYSLPRESFNIPHVIPFHLHAASQDDTKSSGPSNIDMFNSLEGFINYGESHNIVITKLKGRRFNIDFYGFEFNLDESPKDIIIDANDFEIMLDLGNYGY